MKKILQLCILVCALTIPATAIAQKTAKPPKETLTKQQIGDSIVTIYGYYNKFRTDLSERLTQTDDSTVINALMMQYDHVEQNCNQHIFDFCKHYCATSPDALEFIFSLRTMVQKDEIKKIYTSLKGKNKKLPYAELLNTYLQSPIAQIGQKAIDFTATSFDSIPFSLDNIISQKNVILIFGGIENITPRDLQWINMIYDGVDQNKIELIYFATTATTTEELAAQRTEKSLSWNFISDFKGDWSPATIAYNVQATPTIVYITKGGTIADWGVNNLEMIINNLAK